jgi:hypothetical protein
VTAAGRAAVIVYTSDYVGTASLTLLRLVGVPVADDTRHVGARRLGEWDDCGMEHGDLPPRWRDYARRLPSSLDDLKGPAAGDVELPLHVAWSGRRVYDVGDSEQRLVLYALLLAEAQREDLERFLHRDSLVSMWPQLRRLLGPHARQEWERRLLAAAAG